jgi:hypothetical protein
LASIGVGFASLVNGIKRIGSPRASAITTDESSDSEDSEDLESDSDGSEDPNSLARNDYGHEVGDDQEEGKEENEKDGIDLGAKQDNDDEKEDDDETKKNLADRATTKDADDTSTCRPLPNRSDATCESRVPNPPPVRRRPGRPKKQPLIPASVAADSTTESGGVSDGRPRRTRGGAAAPVGSGAATGRRGRGVRGRPDVDQQLSSQPHPVLLLHASSAPIVASASSKTRQVSVAASAGSGGGGPTLRPRKGNIR